MIPVKQTIFHDKERGIRGNCQQAAVASILSLPLDEVPNFHFCDEGFFQGFWNFARSKGYVVLELMPNDADDDHARKWLLGSDVHYLAYGPAARGVRHACVYRNGVLAHDPHPSNAGLLEVDKINVMVPTL